MGYDKKVEYKEEYMFEYIYEQLAVEQINNIDKEQDCSIYIKFRDVIETNLLRGILIEEIKKELRKLSQSVLVVDINQSRESNILLNKDGKAQYKEYLKKFFLDNNFRRFCEKYKLWYERYINITVYVYQYIVEILTHLENDKIGLRRKKLIGKETCRVRDIKFLGDLHNSGRCVVKLSINDKPLIYKPTNGAVYELYGEIIRIVSGNQHYKVIKCFLADTYFWCEYIEDEMCRNIEDIRSYYKNCGYLLACAYLLNSMDIHNENLIACGRYPIIIDAETMISGDMVSDKSSNGRKILQKSVFRSAMIPMKYDKREEGISDCSAIGDEIIVEIVENQLEHEYTSNVTEHRVRKQQKDINTHLPKIGGKVYPVWGYVKELLEGFQEGYQNIIVHSTEIKKLFLQYKKVVIRVVIRSTAVYAELLKRINMPDMLQNSEYVVELLKRILENNCLDEESMRCEVNQLVTGNIPYFMMNMYEDSIRIQNSKVVLEHIIECPSDAVLQKLKNFSDTDRDRQIYFIKIAFNYENCNFTMIKGNTLKEVASEMNRFRNNSRVLVDDELCSFSLQKNWKGQYLYDEMNDGIYEGYLGLMLYDQDVDEKKKADCLRIFGRIGKVRKWGIIDGYAASILYLYESIQFNWDEKEIALRDICSEMEKALPLKANINNIDLIEGMSGTIVAISHFVDKVSIETKERIIWMISELTKRIISVWHEKKETIQKVTGFAHGIAGIKVALYISYCICENQSYYEAFQEMEKQDSLDFYNTINWCNGVVGYYTAYYLLWQFSHFESIYKQKLLQGIQIILKNAFQAEEFCLCHGFLGAIDFLLKMQENALLSDEQIETFMGMQGEIADRLKKKKVCINDISLFTGITGISYMQQRMSENIPSILTYLY